MTRALDWNNGKKYNFKKFLFWQENLFYMSTLSHSWSVWLSFGIILLSSNWKLTIQYVPAKLTTPIFLEYFIKY